MELVKFLWDKIINGLLWIWSHSLIFSLSDDDNFASLEWRLKDKGDVTENKEIPENNNVVLEQQSCSKHLRFSVLNIMLGDTIIYIFSFDFKNRKIDFSKILQLQKSKDFVLNEKQMQDIQDRYRKHIECITDEDVSVEKEKLHYHINFEEQRIKTSVDKINIYSTILLTSIPIVLALIDFDLVQNLSSSVKIMIYVITYSLINILIYVFRTIKVQAISRSSFADLRNAVNKKKEILIQYQYDWQYLKRKADLYVSFVLNIQEWIAFIFILTAVILGFYFYPSIINSKNSVNNPAPIVYSLNVDEIEIPYTSSSVNWLTILLDIETKKCNYIIVLADNDDLPKVFDEIKKYEGMKIDVRIDPEIEQDNLKIIEVN